VRAAEHKSEASCGLRGARCCRVGACLAASTTHCWYTGHHMSVARRGAVQCWQQVTTWTPPGVRRHHPTAGVDSWQTAETTLQPQTWYKPSLQPPTWQNPSKKTHPGRSNTHHSPAGSQTPQLSRHTHKLTAGTQQMLHKQGADRGGGVVDDSHPQAKGPDRRDCPGHENMRMQAP
jgi:hypothetical protein